tara:strand:- start:10 stop:174 length:165 start_codon:yes stop_codon:yes gene_type:complete
MGLLPEKNFALRYVERWSTWVRGAGMFSLGLLVGTAYGSFIATIVTYYAVTINN